MLAGHADRERCGKKSMWWRLWTVLSGRVGRVWASTCL